MTRVKPRAPANLGAPGRRFWRRVVESFELEQYHLDICEQCCRALDRAESAREQIEREGMTLVDRFGQPKPHPLLAAERDARSAFRQLYRELGLDDDQESHEIGRPPRGYCV